MLDNLVEDASGVHEPASMWFFARLGIPAHHDQHIVIAWDDDLTFLDSSYDPMSYQENNVLVRKLMAIPEYRGLYFATLDEAAHAAEEGASDAQPGALEREVRRELDLIDAAMMADTLRPFTDAEYLDAKDAMKVFPPCAASATWNARWRASQGQNPVIKGV